VRGEEVRGRGEDIYREGGVGKRGRSISGWGVASYSSQRWK